MKKIRKKSSEKTVKQDKQLNGITLRLNKTVKVNPAYELNLLST